MTTSDPFEVYTVHAVGLSHYTSETVARTLAFKLGHLESDSTDENAVWYRVAPSELHDGSLGMSQERVLLYFPQTHQGKDAMEVISMMPDVLIEKVYDCSNKTILLKLGVPATILEGLETLLRMERTSYRQGYGIH